MGFNSQNFLILGANSGIGELIASQLIDKGATVYGTSRSGNDLPDGVNSIALDVNDLDDQLNDLPDQLHGVVYAIGTITLKPFQALSSEQFLEDYTINVLGAVKVLQKVYKKLVKAENASIVLFSTVAAKVGLNFHTSIASAKSAIEGLARSLACEWAQKNIRVNCIAPSLTDTPLAENLLNSEDKREAGKKRHPIGRYGKPEDIASASMFLLSDENTWITGQVLSLDGGLSTLRPI
ncbi:SDR family NAD(P)-dependent oxidoreductase [Roseivirga sp. BDSF3-8]|uniref:SDR family NAD(P)-dependent oxidoreductase n=1 Tax=Roseivirga sp. BDSF3-8 TaxID=3241598 RepID=UPI00353216C6